MNQMDSTGSVVDAGPPRTVGAVALASAARTTTQTPADISNDYARNLDVIVDITVNAGGLGSITVAINFKDPASGKYINLLTSAAMTAVGTIVLRVSPHLTAAANLIAQANLARTLQIVVTANNANPVTYSVGYDLSI